MDLSRENTESGGQPRFCVGGCVVWVRYDAAMVNRILPWVILGALAISAAQPADNDAAWKSLLTLVGTWEGTEGGKTATLTYSLVSGGTALMESMKTPDAGPDMVTIYHRDGAALAATHFCSMGNQPRMRAAGPFEDAKTIRFRFVDVTNLAKPDGPHIRHLTVRFVDADHFSQEWVSSGEGKEDTALFKWTRTPKK